MLLCVCVCFLFPMNRLVYHQEETWWTLAQIVQPAWYEFNKSEDGQ